MLDGSGVGMSSRNAQAISVRCSLEGSSCIKCDGDGAVKIILTCSADNESESIATLMKSWREKALIVTFTKYTGRGGS